MGTLVGIFLALCCAAGAAADPPSEQKNVLLLYGESHILPAILETDEAIRARFESVGVPARFFAEYLDLSWASDPRYQEHLRAFLRSKYRNRTLDVMITVGAPALRFALENRAQLFPAVPIVFTAVTPAASIPIDPRDAVTGVWMVADAGATLAAARRLQPHARRVVIVGGASPQDKIFVDDVKQELGDGRDGLETSYLVGLPLEHVREALAGLPRDTIVLLVSILRDASGRTYSARESLHLIAPTSGAPIYGLSDTMVGHGIIGGRVISFRVQGAHAADLAIRILRGEGAPRIAPRGAPANVFMFDWRELTRWGLPERDLPAGSVVLNRPPSLWALYRWHMVGAVGVIAAEGALIVALLSYRRRRRQAEAALTERLTFETLVSDLSATLVKLPGADVGVGIAHGLRRVGEHLDVDRASIFEITPGEGGAHFTHVWVAPGAEPPPSPVDVRRFPWSVNRLRRGQSYCFSRLDQLPEDAAVDRASFARHGIRSGVGIPLTAGHTTIGALTLSVLRREQDWPADLMSRIEFVGGIFASVLSRRRAETELETLRRDLTHVGRVASMGELAASIAHELNQPLTAILSKTQVVQRLIGRGTVDPEELKEILADIVADDRRAAEVIRRLRAFVKKDEPQRARLDINGIVQDVVSLVRSDAIFRNVAVTVELSPEVPAVFADRIQLQQVVLNLVMNGLDAMRDAVDRNLLVTTGIDSVGAVCVTVSDHGGGIAEHDLPRIFEPFYTTKPQGLGMGLAIAQSLVESHGGRLWAENHDKGATFAFTIPASGTEAD